jgi:hypothetical protein
MTVLVLHADAHDLRLPSGSVVPLSGESVRRS